jgi:hypothetical protein
MPARGPAASAPTSFFTGSLSGPVMMSPREFVFTAPVKKRRSNGASGSDGASTLRSNDATCIGVARSKLNGCERGSLPGRAARMGTMCAFPRLLRRVPNSTRM